MELCSDSSIAAMEVVEDGQRQVEITPEPIKYQEIVEKGDEDRISALPENLLLEILSRLPYTKDAIRTGTLSKRWKYLWTSVPTLSFKDTDYNRPLSDFFSFVDKTLTQCRQLKLQKFKLYTLYEIGFESQINNWICYAISCKVEELRLTLLSTNCIAKFPLDQIFFTSSSFTDLKLSGRYMLNPVGSVSWKNLRSLFIFDCELDEVLIEKILSGSPVLETLVLNYCYGFKRLNITSGSIKNLVLCGYQNLKDEYYEVDDIVKINAPNILSLTIRGNLMLWKLLLVNVSSIVEAELDYIYYRYYEAIEEEMLKKLIVNLRHVKELKIGIICSQVVPRLVAKGFTIPTNVKLPDVTYDWLDSDSVKIEDQ